VFGIANNSIILVLGGARSGKSACGEQIASAFGMPRVYIATAQAFDDEMSARIAAHKVDRGEGWQTVEAPLALADALAAASGAVLVDCMTLWLSNLVLAERDVEAELAGVLDVLDRLEGPVVMVSNELGMGLVPETPLGRSFRDSHGRMNQALAKRADQAVFVAAGLPLALKGALPKGATW